MARSASVHECAACGFRMAVEERLATHRWRAHPEGWAGMADALPGPPFTASVALNAVVAANWLAIRTYHRRRTVMDLLNARVWDGRAERAGPSLNAHALLVRAWADVQTRAKVDCIAGCALEHKITGELRYYRSSSNNASLLGGQPRVVGSLEDLHRLYDDVTAIDPDASASNQFDFLPRENVGFGTRRRMLEEASGRGDDVGGGRRSVDQEE